MREFRDDPLNSAGRFDGLTGLVCSRVGRIPSRLALASALIQHEQKYEIGQRKHDSRCNDCRTDEDGNSPGTGDHNKE